MITTVKKNNSFKLIRLCLVSIFFISSISNAQNQQKLDSLFNKLEKKIKESEIDSIYIQLLLDIGDQFEYSKPDSALYYYKKASFVSKKIKNKSTEALSFIYIGVIYSTKGDYNQSFNNFRNALSIYEELEDKNGISRCYNNIGIIYKYLGNYEQAITYYTKSLKNFESMGDKLGICQCYTNIGIINIVQGNFPKAIEFNQKALKIAEELKDKALIGSCFLNIANVHFKQKNYQQAEEYFQKSLKLAEELNNKSDMSNGYNNLGTVYFYLKKYNLVIDYFQKALIISEELGDKKGMIRSYNNIGIIFKNQGNYKRATECYEMTLKIAEELEDKEGIARINSNISELYKFIADSIACSIGEKQKNYEQSIKYGLKAFEQAKEINALPLMHSTSGNLQYAYKSIGNLSKALEFAEIFNAVNDSMFNEEKTNALVEMEARYQTEKKQKEIELLNKDKALQTTELKKNRVLLFAFVVGFIFMIILALVVYKSLQNKKKANHLLASQKREIEEKNEELNQQNEEIKSQRDEIEIQKSQIEFIHKELTDSIHYAVKIQQAVLPTNDFLNDILPEHFVLFKPQSLVSGDFYWASKITIDNIPHLIIAVADCTGHGVPGAFMSMLGVSFLNEIVLTRKISKPNIILNELRDKIIIALKQKGQSEEHNNSITLSVKDGMDISLITIDILSFKAQWAGANNPLYIIRNRNNNLMVVDEYLLEEIKPDKMPIGIYEKMDDFSCHGIQLHKGDCIYLFSDGFCDQFGGEKGKKFKQKQLKKLLISISNKSMIKQKELIQNEFDNWTQQINPTTSQSYEQVDDIVFLGIKL